MYVYYQVWEAKMIRLFKNYQIVKNIFENKNYFFQKFWGDPGSPWSSSGSAIVLIPFPTIEILLLLLLLLLFERLYVI